MGIGVVRRARPVVLDQRDGGSTLTVSADELRTLTRNTSLPTDVTKPSPTVLAPAQSPRRLPWIHD